MSIRRVFSLVVLIVGLAALGESQQKQIKYVPVQPTSPASGQEMYTAYCAVCHGKAGKGNGPAAEALKVPPPDLTILARKNENNYPYDRVRSAIVGDERLTVHGSKDMPVWGPIFRAMGTQSDAVAQLRVRNLTKY
ncbi:MAG: cytochrome c, partial [Candidatus Sulfotelmatobacter sp.]